MDSPRSVSNSCKQSQNSYILLKIVLQEGPGELRILARANGVGDLRVRAELIISRCDIHKVLIFEYRTIDS